MAEYEAVSSNNIRSVAIVGAGGRSGRAIVQALIDAKKHQITAITRPNSQSTIPPGVSVKKAKYDDHSALVSALQGQDILIITMAVMAPKDSQIKLIDAAVEAGVRYIIPNEWGIDISDEKANEELMMRDRYGEIRRHIEKAGKGQVHWIGISCGFWYEFSLAGTEARYGFDFDKKAVTMFSGGTEKINTSTWPQVGRAVANLLSLPDISRYHEKSIYVSSFFVNQQDMFESVLRVTGDKKEHWTVTEEDVVARFRRGQKLFKEGKIVGFGILLYSRVFFDDHIGDFNRKLDNALLKLPQESLDDATRVAIEMAARGETNALH